jgi:hypothetical protein
MQKSSALKKDRYGGQRNSPADNEYKPLQPFLPMIACQLFRRRSCQGVSGISSMDIQPTERMVKTQYEEEVVVASDGIP